MATSALIRRGSQVYETGLPRDTDDVLERIGYLREVRDRIMPNMYRTRQVLAGGESAVQALIGQRKPEGWMDLPIANYMVDAAEALASRLGPPPELKVPKPDTGRASDESQSKLHRAEKRERIVNSYDQFNQADAQPLEIQLPQLVRWLTTGSYCVVTLSQREVGGFPYPIRTWRDPLDTMLAQWQPLENAPDCGFVRKTDLKKLKEAYPEKADEINRRTKDQTFGGVLLRPEDPHAGPGVEVVDYYDETGYWKFVPQFRLLLEYIPNRLDSGPAFVALTTYNFSRLRGEYDDIIGLMISMARLNILAEVAVREDVFAPTNIYGGEPVSGQYRKGRNAVNVFDGNTQVDIPRGTIQHQAWQQIDRLERQLSIESTTPPQDRGESTMSFVTGRGLNQLEDRVTRKVRELQTVLSNGLVKLDARTLEYDEKHWPNIDKPLVGRIKGSDYEESYTPGKDIRGNYVTRREYGAMAGVEEAAKLNGLAIMDSAGWVSKRYIRSQIDRLGVSESEMTEQMRFEQAEEAFDQLLLTHASNPESPEHMRALQMLVDILPTGDKKSQAEKWLSERGQALDEQEQASVQQGQPQQPPSARDLQAALQGARPTTLAGVTSGGQPRGGTQVVQEGG